MNDDAQLIHQTLAGHSAAFGQLVVKYQDRLYNTVFHVVGNAEDAKDVVQDAFVQAFLKVDTLQRAARFTPGSTALPSTWRPPAIAGAGRPCRWTSSAWPAAATPSTAATAPPSEPERAERCRQVRRGDRRVE